MSSKKPILIVCASDTLVKLLVPVGQALSSRNLQVQYATLMYSRERAEFYLRTAIDVQSYVGVVVPSTHWLNSFAALLVGNDWGDEVKSIIFMCKSLGIPVICVQESVIDFSGGKRRLSHATHILLQGDVSRKLLFRSDNVYITGNPRYDSIERHPLPDVPKVFVNVNFTYGIEEENRDAWITAVLNACKLTNLKAILVQHPRDKADLSVYGNEYVRSSASVVHSLIRESSLVITRFSSLIHEAICSGRPVVYFNPNSEKICYDFGSDGRVLAYTTDPVSLVDYLQAMHTDPPSNNEIDAYLNKHLYSHGSASKNCANAIVKIIETHNEHPSRFQIPKAIYFQLKAMSKDLYRFIFGLLR